MRTRAWRVSAFAPGAAITATPLVHRKSAKRASADANFQILSQKCGKEFGRVILHQGNLRRHAFLILRETSAPVPKPLPSHARVRVHYVPVGLGRDVFGETARITSHPCDVSRTYELTFDPEEVRVVFTSREIRPVK